MKNSACAWGKRNNRKIVLLGFPYWAFIRWTERPRQVPEKLIQTKIKSNEFHQNPEYLMVK